MKFIRCYGLFFVGLLVLQSSCREGNTKKVIKTAPITFKKEGVLTISNAKTDSLLVSLDIEIAETDYETETGLMYRDAMKEKQGMLFIFPDMRLHYFYMKNTKIPLDIVFIDDHLHIVSFQKNAKPMDETSLPSEVPAKYVLEINAGLSKKWGLQVGDSIAFQKH